MYGPFENDASPRAGDDAELDAYQHKKFGKHRRSDEELKEGAVSPSSASGSSSSEGTVADIKEEIASTSTKKIVPKILEAGAKNKIASTPINKVVPKMLEALSKNVAREDGNGGKRKLEASQNVEGDEKKKEAAEQFKDEMRVKKCQNWHASIVEHMDMLRALHRINGALTVMEAMNDSIGPYE